MLSRALKRLAASATLVSLVVGIPAALAALGGNPLHALADFARNPLAPDDGSLFFAVFTSLGWGAWASFTLSVLVEIPGAFGRTVRAIPGLSGQQAIAAALLAVIATGTAASQAGNSGHRTGAPPRPTIVAAAPAVVPDDPAAPAVLAPESGNRPSAGPESAGGTSQHLTHRVRRGEALLDLAEHYYGDPAGYERILRANTGITQPDGRTLQPGQTRIYEGWRLRIPLPVTAAAAEPAATPTQAQATTVELAAYQVRDPAVHAAARTPARESSTTAAVSDPPDWARRAPGDVHRVVRGDTLWDIAKAKLGDPYRWPEIYALNRGRPQANGHALRDPSLIRVGWVLALPATPIPPQADQPSTSSGDDHTPPTSRPDSTAEQPPAGPTAQATTVPDDDGVAAPPAGPPAPANALPGATPSGPATSTPAADSPSSDRPGPRGVPLLTGSWVDLGLAAAAAAAAALIWNHRRRRYQPRPPSARPRLHDPDLTPIPPVVTQLRRALRHPTTDDAPDHDAATPGTPPTDSDGATPPTTEAPLHHDAPTPPPAAAAAAADDRPHPPGTPPLVVPSLDNPLSTLWPPAGLGLTGPGGEAAARGFLAAALATGGVDNPHSRTQVVIPFATAATLLGTSAIALPRTARLTVTGGLDDALEILETQTLRRTRLVYQHEAATIADLRRADPHEEPQPPIVLITDVTASHERARIAALLAQGQRLDIHGILLGAWPDGDTVRVDLDGTTTPDEGETSRHGTHPADIGRLTVLTPTETVDLLATLTEAHTGEPQTPAPAEAANPADPPHHGHPTADPPTPPTGHPADPSPANLPAVDSSQPSDHPVNATGAQPQPGPAATTTNAAAVDTAPPTTGGDTAPEGGRVTVQVLGDARIIDVDTTETLRAKALELLVYLVVHDGEATRDAILDDLLPDAPAARAPHRLHTYVSALRKTLARTGGPATYLAHPSHRYALNRQAFDTDLWRMRDALRDAERAITDDQRTAALRRAIDAYTGALAEGFDYEWIEAHREGIRRQALDAHLALAAATADPTEALAVLEAAIRHDPYAEPVYQQAMRVHATLGHLDEIRALRRKLTRQLEEIDAEPGEDTIALADRLITDLRQHRPAGQPDRRHRGRHP